MDTTPQRDAALADMLAILCYEWDVGIQRGRNLFHGFFHVYPGHTDLLPEAYRALQSCERLGTEQEGQPICIEAWACIVMALLGQGVEEAALITSLSYDCLLRGQDWQGLRLRHVRCDAAYDHVAWLRRMCTPPRSPAYSGERGARRGFDLL